MLKKWVVTIIGAWILLSVFSFLNSKYFISDTQRVEYVNVTNKSSVGIKFESKQKSSVLLSGEKVDFQLDTKKSIQAKNFQLLNMEWRTVFDYWEFVRYNDLGNSWFIESLKEGYSSWSLSVHTSINHKQDRYYLPFYILNDTMEYTISIDIK